jgi:hypothetical protein
MCLYAKYLAKMTQVSYVASGPLVLFMLSDESFDIWYIALPYQDTDHV